MSKIITLELPRYNPNNVLYEKAPFFRILFYKRAGKYIISVGKKPAQKG